MKSMQNKRPLKEQEDQADPQSTKVMKTDEKGMASKTSKKEDVHGGGVASKDRGEGAQKSDDNVNKDEIKGQMTDKAKDDNKNDGNSRKQPKDEDEKKSKKKEKKEKKDEDSDDDDSDEDEKDSDDGGIEKDENASAEEEDAPDSDDSRYDYYGDMVASSEGGLSDSD